MDQAKADSHRVITIDENNGREDKWGHEKENKRNTGVIGAGIWNGL